MKGWEIWQRVTNIPLIVSRARDHFRIFEGFNLRRAIHYSFIDWFALIRCRGMLVFAGFMRPSSMSSAIRCQAMSSSVEPRAAAKRSLRWGWPLNNRAEDRSAVGV